MSWGSTAFTPIVTRNVPPFGFHEVITPPDFKVCNQNPWGTGERMKREIQDKLKLDEYRKRLNVSDKSDYDMGYDMDYNKAQQLRCLSANDCLNYSSIETFVNGAIFGYSFTSKTVMLILCVVVLWFFYNKKISLGFR